MRRAVACLPAPGSARSRTGTSLWASSRITASTGRMLALVPATNSVISPSIGISETVSGLPQSRDGFPIFSLPYLSPIGPQLAAWLSDSKRLAERLSRTLSPFTYRSNTYFFNNLQLKLSALRTIPRILGYLSVYTPDINSRKNFSHFHRPLARHAR